MSMQVECPDCSKQHELTSEMAAEPVLCSCGARFHAVGEGLPAIKLFEMDLGSPTTGSLKGGHDLQAANVALETVQPESAPESVLPGWLNTLIGKTTSVRIARISLYVILLALCILAPKEFKAQSQWEEAYLELDKALDSSIVDVLSRLDMKDNIRRLMEDEYGAELVEGKGRDIFQFGGVIRKYWIDVHYNHVYQTDSVARDFGWRYPQLEEAPVNELYDGP